MKSELFIAVRNALITIVALVGWCSGANAAEIRLRNECQPKGNLVLLDDVAEVFAADSQETERLSNLELGPAPAPGAKRYLRVREVQDLLDARGENLALHRFSGSNQVTIKSGDVVVKSTPVIKQTAAAVASPRTTPIQGKQAQQLATEAIVAYLQTIAAHTWQVKLQLTDGTVRQLQSATGTMTASGGDEPWIGKQQFVISFVAGNEQVQLPLEAQVLALGSVVVTARPVARGAIVHASDLTVQAGTAPDEKGKSQATFSTIDDVIGMEATRAIAAGQVLDQQYVRRPLMVRKGEVVTVYSRAGGIQVRTTARAIDDGSLSDVVAVESLTDRQKFLARVTAVQVVEVYARSTSIAATPDTTPRPHQHSKAGAAIANDGP